MAGLTDRPSGGSSRNSAAFAAWSPLARAQYAALIWVQRRIFLNTVRSVRGSFELGARVLTGLIFFVIALGPALGMGFAAYAGAASGRRLAIAVLLWVLCVVWQFFSALAPALAGQNPDLTYLLRFPVSLSSWILLYLVYGIVTPSTLIGALWAVGIGIGITVARPGLFLWTALTLALLVLFNIMLSRTILAWVERWMAQRRTREIVTGAMLVAVLGAQFLNPAFHHYDRGLPFGLGGQQALHLSSRIWNAQAIFPPGLATVALVRPLAHRGGGVLPLGGLALYTLAVTGLLCVRLRSESRGESASELRRVPPARVRGSSRRRPWLDLSGPVAAVAEKDLRYILRSGPMLYYLAAPLVMVFLFSTMIRAGTMGGIRTEYGLPLGVVWAFLGLTRVVSNAFGGEAQGVSFYFLSPTPLRTVMLGKNATQLLLFAIECSLITALVIFRLGLPAPSIVAATLAWLLFAIPADLAIGNALSIVMPYRMNMTRMRGGQGGIANTLLSQFLHAALFGIGVLVFVPLAVFHRPWLATPVLLVLAAAGVFAYLRVLANVDVLLERHKESLLLEIAKPG